MINNARTLQDPRIPPANRLQALKGKRRGQHSIRIDDWMGPQTDHDLEEARERLGARLQKEVAVRAA